MIAHRLVEDARSAGLSLEVDGADLIVEADRNPPAELIAELRQHKAAVIAFLLPQLGGAREPAASPERPPANNRAGAVWGSAKAESAGILKSEQAVPRIGIPELPDEPILLRDGRRLWRFRADVVPEQAFEPTVELVDKAQWHGAVLVADGLELIVVERWLSVLPPSALLELRESAGEVIALLRRQSRIRCAGREQVFEPTCRNRTDEQ